MLMSPISTGKYANDIEDVLWGEKMYLLMQALQHLRSA